MFGRFNEIDDKPDWREKLAELRSSPPWVPKRPEWLSESPAALVLLFTGIALALISVVYLVVPATALPSSLPGRWSAPTTSSTPSTASTTTTTVPLAKRQAAFQARLSAIRRLGALTSVERERALGLIRTLTALEKEDAATQAILDAPPVPPARRWVNAFLAATLAGGSLAAAWFISEARSRRQFRR